MKPLPFISVVIPAYNEEKYLPDCLTALAKQNYPKDKYRIIVANNNSTDKTEEIARKYGAAVVNEKKQGHVFALNTGMKNATGEIIAVTDSDTRVSSTWLKTIARVFEDKDVVAVTGYADYSYNSKISRYLWKFSYKTFMKAHFALGKPNIIGPNLAVRRNAFLAIKGLDTRYEISSDTELGLRIKKVGKVVFCPELSVTTSPRRWQKGSLEDYYKNINSYLHVVWLQQPPKGSLTPRR